MMLPYGYWTRRMRMRRSLQLVNCLASTLGLSQKLQQVFWFPNFQNTNIQIDSDTWFSNILFFVIVLISHHHQLAHPPPAAFSEVMQRPFLIKSHGCWNQTWTPCAWWLELVLRFQSDWWLWQMFFVKSLALEEWQRWQWLTTISPLCSRNILGRGNILGGKMSCKHVLITWDLMNMHGW